MADQFTQLKTGTAKGAYTALVTAMTTGLTLVCFGRFPDWLAVSIMAVATPVILFMSTVIVNVAEKIADSLPGWMTKPVGEDKPLEVRT